MLGNSSQKQPLWFVVSTQRMLTIFFLPFGIVSSLRFISQLLKFEFIYKPAPDLEDNVELTIESLVRRGILQPSPTDPSAIAIDPSGTETFTFLCMLVWPFIEAYYIAIASLFALQPDILM